VSGQVRNELLPLLVKDQTIRVHLRHIDAFLQSTLAQHVFHRCISAETSIKIELNMDKPIGASTWINADIAPLIRLATSRPNCQLTFTSGVAKRQGSRGDTKFASMIEELNCLFRLVQLAAWKRVCEKVIVKVKLAESSSWAEPSSWPAWSGGVEIALRQGCRWRWLSTLGFQRWGRQESVFYNERLMAVVDDTW
jgi:hypothetical protein